MNKHLLLLAAALSLGGCATVETIKANPSDLGSLQGQPLTVVSYPAPSFTALTPGKAAAGGLFGAVGGAIAGASMNSAGNQIVAENGVTDPSAAILAKLERDYVTLVRPSGVARLTHTGDDSVKDVTELVGGKGLVLDVRTTAWMFGYFPTSWGRYRVTYFSRARLIDASTGKLIGQVPCQYVSDADDSSAPSYDEMLANRAALLKSRLDNAATSCGDVLASGLSDNTAVAAAPAPAPVVAAAPVAAAPIAAAAAPAPVAVPAPPAVVAAAAPVQLAAAKPVAPGPYVAVQPLSLLRQPSAGAPVERTVPAGTTAQLKQRMVNASGAWYFVEADGAVGWVSDSTLVR